MCKEKQEKCFNTCKHLFYLALKEFFNVEAPDPGKKVLDIGYGSGEWACLSAECGAKNIDGFDIQGKEW